MRSDYVNNYNQSYKNLCMEILEIDEEGLNNVFFRLWPDEEIPRKSNIEEVELLIF